MLVFDDGIRRIHALTLGVLGTNCFIVDTQGLCFLVDPVDDAAFVAAYCAEQGLRPEFALATHAHFDHVAAAAGLLERNVITALWLHQCDASELERCRIYSMLIAKRPIALPPKDKVCWFDDELAERLGTAGFVLWHLPGHTPGSTILHSAEGNLLFTGDTITHHMVRNVRTAIGEDGNGLLAAYQAIEDSFQPKALVFPGHGKLSWLGMEFAYNPSIRQLRGRML